MSFNTIPTEVAQGPAGDPADPWPVNDAQTHSDLGSVITALGSPTQQGSPITGQSLEAGGASVLGWLSSVRKAITDRLPAALGAGGGLKVDGSGTALPVSGTVTANQGAASATPWPVSDGSGSLSVDDGGASLTVDGTVATTSAAGSQADGHSATLGYTTDPSTATTVIGRLQKLVALLGAGLPSGLGSGGGVMVDVVSSTLPVGAATAARQPSLGVAGTPSGDVITVQGAGPTGTPLPVSASVGAGAATIAKAEDSASADGDVGVPAMAVRRAAPANSSGTDGDYEPLQMSAGRLWISAKLDTSLPAGSANIGKVDLNAAADGAITTLGTTTDAAAYSGDGSVIALLKALRGGDIKRLYGPALLTGSAATKYTVTTGKTGRIDGIHLNNTTATDETVTIAIGTDAAGTRIADALPVPAHSIVQIPGPFVMTSTEILQAFASTTNTITLTVTGAEL